MPQTSRPVPTGRLRRALPVAGLTARAAAERVAAGLRERLGDERAVDQFHQCTADRYARLLGDSRGVLMKAGQLLSLLDGSVFGAGAFTPYQQALTGLQSDAPPMDVAVMYRRLESELGDGLDQFAEFDERPLAAASIGQVHRATLRDGRMSSSRSNIRASPERSATTSPTLNCSPPF